MNNCSGKTGKEGSNCRCRDHTPEAIKSITKLINSMSGELKTPLNSMIGFSELLLFGMEGPLNEKQRERLNGVLENGYELLHLINDLLVLSKIHAGKAMIDPRMLDLRFMVAELITGYQHEADKKGIKLEYAQPGDIPMVYADPVLIKRIMENLISNAIKYTSGGSVGIVYEDLVGDDYVRVMIWDTGVGIDDENKKRIFDEFYRVNDDQKQDDGGIGLGLTLSKYFVELMGGKIWLEDNTGGGTRFYFTVPKVQRGCKIRIKNNAGAGSKRSRADGNDDLDGGLNSKPCAVVNDNIYWCDAAKLYYYFN